MTRRIVRTIVQLSSLAVFTFIAVLLLDRSYRVLPNSIHGHLPTHHPGFVLTDITIAKCSSVSLFSSCDLDPDHWHRVEKELFLGKTWTSSAYMYISRKREEDLTPEDRVIVDVTVGRLDPGGDTDEDQWEPRPAGIWIKRSTNKKTSDADNAITNIDVLFGDDAVEARQGWAIVGTPMLLGAGNTVLSAHITAKRGGQHDVPRRTKPRVPESGRFKIMQVADLHLSTGLGACRNPVPDGYNGGPCEADPRTLDFVANMLDDEKPDMVVLSGDQVNGDTAPDAPTAIFKIAALLIERKIPYVAIFGNHDDEKTMSREGQMALMETLPYSLAVAGPADVDGVGNYYVEVLARGKSEHSALTIYLLDTHSYSPDERNFPGYDWLKPSQIEWFRRTAVGLKGAHSRYNLRHMDPAFVHIPLTEYADYEQPRVGAWREGVTAPLHNSLFRDALVEQGVVMVSAGHDHCNDYCALNLDPSDYGKEKTKDKDKEPLDATEVRKPALWMCYGGGVGFGGYGGYNNYVRRLRLFEIDVNEARITTWKRLEVGTPGERIDEQIIVDGGKPIPPPPGDQAKDKPPVQ